MKPVLHLCGWRQPATLLLGAMGLVALVLSLSAGEGVAAEPDWRSLRQAEVWGAWMKKDLGLLRSEAQRGGAVAQYLLYHRLREQGEPPGSIEAWLRQAAEQGLPQAQLWYAREIYDTNMAGAFQWMLEAAQTGLAQAQFDVAEMGLQGLVPVGDLEFSLHWLRAAADQRLPDAQYLLALLYSCGNGEPRHSDETPARLLQNAAARGHPQAMIELARRFRVGHGVSRNYLEACEWLARADSTGRVPRQDEQAVSYLQGDPQVREFLQVFRTYRAAMEQHDADGMFQLGEIARSGRYGDPDYERSYFWHCLAARHGQKQSVAKVEWLEQNLATEQIRKVTDALARFQSR